MQLQTGDQAPRVRMTDVEGNPMILGGSRRRTLLCFFGDAACPFCNVRVFQLIARCHRMASAGIDVVVVFCATQEAAWRFISGHPRPFPVIADPGAVAFGAYRVEASLWGKLKAIVTRAPTWFAGLRMVGVAGLGTNRTMPAEFLIDERGRIADAHYGRDTGDYLPFERIEAFGATTAAHAEPMQPFDGKAMPA